MAEEALIVQIFLFNKIMDACSQLGGGGGGGGGMV